MHPFKDQRRDDRVRYDLPVFFFFTQGKRKPREVTYLKAYTQDISQTGLKVLVENPSDETIERLQAKGVHVELEIYLPSMFRSKPLNCSGEIRWRERKDGDVVVGVDLLDLEQKHRETLKRVAKTLREVTDEILGDEGA